MSSSTVHEPLIGKIRALPLDPGIYLFLDAGGAPLYVGKAKALRKRVLSYLKVAANVRLGAMMAEARDLDFVVTSSEADALALENAWIKRHQPRYNIRLRDDKTYPYVKLTVQERYPKVVFTRRIFDDGALYFGPFLPGGVARRAIKLVQKLFQVRICRIEVDGTLPRPCLYYDMRRCLGPCVDGLTTDDDYRHAVEQARLLLAGRTDELLVSFRRSMLEASTREEYEEAARLRDLIAEVEAITQRRRMATSRAEDVDIYGAYVAGGNAVVTALVMRGGQVMDRRELHFEGIGKVSPEELFDELLPQIYERTTMIPREIHLPTPILGMEALASWLSERRGERVYVRMPSRGPKADRIRVAEKNARQTYSRRFRTRSGLDLGAIRLQDLLGLVEPPRRIEGFDVSTFQGADTVASLVVWDDGRMLKRDYRSFNIRGLDKPDDFASIAQAVERRYRRLLEETGEMPDLILIDGGRGQLNAALGALARLGVEETPVVGLAKQEEEIYSPDQPEAMRLVRTDDGLKLLQRVRDEAHRFAVSRHRRRRSASTLRSRFDDLQGVGDKRRKLLVRRFGSYRGLQEAKLEEVAEVLGRKVAARVFAQLHVDHSES